MKRLKVGVIGLGEVSQIIHLPILDSMKDKFEIAAICDVSGELLSFFGDKYKVDKQYTNSIKLTEQEDLDAVLILHSDEYHTECAVSAAKNKKHVLLEKPMCLTLGDADKIINARDENNVQIMIGYMRRFAPAYIRAVEEVKKLPKINYARIRDIIGLNSFFIEQSSNVLRPTDISQEAIQDKADTAKRMALEAIGDVPKELISAYRYLCSLSSHDLSATREIIGMPRQVSAARQWNNGGFINAIFEYDDYFATFETGIDKQRRFDAHIEVYGEEKSIKVQYNTPYIRHLPTMLYINETKGEAYQEIVERPTFVDPYTLEIEYFYDVVTKGLKPKTTPEDAKEDLQLFQMIMEQLKRN